MSKFDLNTANVEKIQSVGEYLLGTTNSVEEGLATEFGEGAELEDFDPGLLQELDDICMMCDGCNWWVEPGFLDDKNICDDCA